MKTENTCYLGYTLYLDLTHSLTHYLLFNVHNYATQQRLAVTRTVSPSTSN